MSAESWRLRSSAARESAHVVERDGGERRHLAREPLVVGREPCARAPSRSARACRGPGRRRRSAPRWPPSRPSRPWLSKPAVAASISSSGYEHEDLAPFDDAREPGRVRQAVHLADPVDVVAVEARATRAPARAARGAREGTRRRSTRSSRGPWRPARRAGPGCRRAARPAPRRRGGRAHRSAVTRDVVHGLHRLAAGGIGVRAYGLNGTFVVPWSTRRAECGGGPSSAP